MPAPIDDNDHRQRILQALADVLMTRRYADVTIADIAAQARISKRTFYEQFDNKEACLIALGESTSEQMMWAILQAYQPGMRWPQIVQDVTQAYLQVIQASPSLMHALYVELIATGRPGLAVRRTIGLRFADFLCTQVAMLRDQGESLRPLDRLTAMAVVAGINELILLAMMDSDTPELMGLADTAMALVHAVTRP
jgi:AcrR family transcriptional regulator